MADSRYRDMDMPAPPHAVFITGGTGYIGSRLIPSLLERGHGVTGLVRGKSRNMCLPRCHAVSGDALHRSSYAHAIQPSDTFVPLVGVAHPSPSKAKLFKEIDPGTSSDRATEHPVNGIQVIKRSFTSQRRDVYERRIDSIRPNGKFDGTNSCANRGRARAFRAPRIRPTRFRRSASGYRHGGHGT